MRLELAVELPPARTEREREMQASMLCDALLEYTQYVIRNNANRAATEHGDVGIDGTGRLECGNGVKITEQLVATA